MQSWLTLILSILVTLLLAVRSQKTVLYKRIGDEVILTPASQSNPITKILWKQNSDIAIEWDGKNTDAYRHFKNHGSLNNATGELTISRLSSEFNGEYTHEINGVLQSNSVELSVIHPVPKPEIYLSCNHEKTSCTLTCEGNITGADPIKYKWEFNNTEQEKGVKEFEITPERTADKFVCVLKNPVSEEKSKPISNPFLVINPKIYIGLIVFFCLLTVVVIAVVTHRVKAGAWFYEKDSLPCDPDFWRKTGNRAAPEPQNANKDKQEGEVPMLHNS